MTWTVSALDMVCGSCLQPIPAGNPVCLLGVPQRPRCQGCAATHHGFYPDPQEIENERWRVAQAAIERRRREEASAHAGATQRPLGRRVPPVPRKPTPFSRLGEIVARADARALAAAGDRDDN